MNTEKPPGVDQKRGGEAMSTRPSNILNPTSAIHSPSRWARIRAVLESRRSLLAKQGTIVASWRTYQGRRLGPYYRLAYREAGRQCSIYLGCACDLVRRVQATLARFQQALRQSQIFSRMHSAARKALRQSKVRLRQQLAAIGIRLKGFEFRGVRAAFAHRRRPFPPPSPGPNSPPPTFIPPVPPSLRKWFWGGQAAPVFPSPR